MSGQQQTAPPQSRCSKDVTAHPHLPGARPDSRRQYSSTRGLPPKVVKTGKLPLLPKWCVGRAALWGLVSGKAMNERIAYYAFSCAVFSRARTSIWRSSTRRSSPTCCASCFVFDAGSTGACLARCRIPSDRFAVSIRLAYCVVQAASGRAPRDPSLPP